MNVKITEDNVEHISSYKYKEENISLIFSTSGIIQIHKNKIDRLKVIDFPVKEMCLGDYEFLCDESKYIVDCEWFQIPMNHTIEKVKKVRYRLRPGALVELVVETRIVDGSKIAQPLPYFITKTNDLSHGVEEDICSFLAAFKSNST